MKGDEIKIIKARHMNQQELDVMGWKQPMLRVDTNIQKVFHTHSFFGKGVLFELDPEGKNNYGTGYDWRKHVGQTIIEGATPEKIIPNNDREPYYLLKKTEELIVESKMFNELYQLKDEFLKKWSIEKLHQMTIDDYTNLDKNSFCYWVEHITAPLGSIKGGSSYKFGIYKRSETSNTGSTGNRLSDGDYAWFKKYGNSTNEAFENVRSIIIDIAKLAKENNLKAIDEIDIGNAYKWKIAFLYSNYNVINIFKYESLLDCADYLGYTGIEKSHSTLNNYVITQIGSKDFFQFSHELWGIINDSLENPNEINNDLKMKLNQILYGPPGTGKTYKTKELAVNIVLGKKERTRDEILTLYDDLVNKEKVCFTTFHQSMSYEDFVEGIKPETNENDEVVYSVQDGIFKSICTSAQQIAKIDSINEQIDFSTKSFFKMSLGGKHRKDIHNWCIANNYIALGWGGNNNYSILSNYNHWDKFKEEFIKNFPDLDADSAYNKQAVYCFQQWMQKGDVVVATLGNSIVDAIGIIDGDYEFDENKEIPFNHFRKVKWLATNLNTSPKIFIDKNVSQQTIYKFADEDVKLEVFEEKFSNKPSNNKQDVGNYVLIIDEINRGNVSAIFGELITLIEDDKRKGSKEEINLTLPYSKLPFSVPNNVYIIGTMNTADRSVEALDTALRRRFSFEELLPKPSLLNNLDYKEVNLEQLLDTINQRIELLIDKDHQIGHSYFFTVKSLDDLKLVFQDKIIPLLEEYFYGDYGKIGLVLGESFIAEKSTQNKNVLASFKAYSDVDFITDKKIFKLKDIGNMSVADFKSIYEIME